MKITFIFLSLILLIGCTQHQEVYYKAVQEQNMAYMNAYTSVENESVTFDGTFTGTISIVKPKELPKLQYIEPPKSGSEIALDWARLIIPTAGMVAGMHYNYKSIDSNNKYNSKNISAWTGNFDKSSITSTSISDIQDISNISNTSNTEIRETTNTEIRETDTSNTEIRETDTNTITP